MKKIPIDFAKERFENAQKLFEQKPKSKRESVTSFVNY
jgi:hypothetical protein